MKKISVLFALLTVLCLLAAAACADEQGPWRLDWFQGGAMGIEFTDVVLDDEGSVISLRPSETVTDVVVEDVIWDEYAAGEVVFAAVRMETNQVLNLQAYLYDVMPRFRIDCKNAAGEHERWYIGDSGEDGSLLLIPADEVENSWYEPAPDLTGLQVAGGSLIGVRYSCSGNEEGNTYELEIGWTEDGPPELTVMQSEVYDQPIAVSRYRLDREVLVSIAAVVNAQDMTVWIGLPDVIEVCDAAQPYLTLIIEGDDGEISHGMISGYADLPGDGMTQVLRLMRSAIRSDMLIESYQWEQE